MSVSRTRLDLSLSEARRIVLAAQALDGSRPASTFTIRQGESLTE